MFPPGRCIFLRPLKSRASKQWEGVWVSPRDIIGARGVQAVSGLRSLAGTGLQSSAHPAPAPAGNKYTKK